MVRVTVSHNIRIQGASLPLRAAVMTALTMTNPAFTDRQKKSLPTYGIEKQLHMFVMDQGAIVTPRGFYSELRDILKTHGIDVAKVTEYQLEEGHCVDFGQWNPAYQLMPDQQPAVIAALRTDGTLIAPAGSGKTLMGMYYLKKRGRTALWLTHTADLMYQSAANASKYLLGVGEVGLIGDGKTKWGDGKLIVATVQMLEANPHLVDALKKTVGTIVVDEAHHFPAPMFIDVVGKFPSRYMLGLTATPERKDKLERFLYTGIGPICHEIKRTNLYETGRLIKPEVEFVYTGFSYDQLGGRTDYDNVDAGGEDLDYVGMIKTLIQDEQRAVLIAEKILKESPNNYSIVLTESVRYCYVLMETVERLAMERYGVAPRMDVVHGGIQKYAWHAAKSLEDAQRRVANGDAVEYRHKGERYQVKVEQYTDDEMARWQVTSTTRKAIMARASNKQVDILFATQLAREGLDMPHLNRGHSTMPKRGDVSSTRKDGAAVEQEIGRIMRPDPMNPSKKAKWIDYTDWDVGIFRDQYYSRRRVYKRLEIPLPKKKKDPKEEAADFLGSGLMFDGGFKLDLPY